MRFDDAFIDQVRSSASIVDVVSGYLPLKKKGKDFSALCPFHNEKTPSFYVSEVKQIFKCFGCGAGGDVFGFIMRMEGLNFHESIQHLAQSLGISLPASSPRAKGQSDQRSRWLKLMKTASAFFRSSLRSESGPNPAADYLRGRGIGPEAAQAYGIGFAPAGNALLRHALGEGYSKQDAIDCGLAKANDNGEVYSYFRNRVIFPIREPSGRIIAFGGRILGEGKPKYLNSPETEIYSKSRTLFGLDLARDEIRRRDAVILVEGYFDCVIPHQAGVRNIVASLGTSLTCEHAHALRRYTRNVFINYDPDPAGTNAALRSIELLLEEGFQIRVVELPDGLDPDDFIRDRGVEAYRERISSASPYLDFALTRLMQEQDDPYSPRAKQEIVTRILSLILKIPERIERAEHLKRVAHRLGIQEELLLAQFRKMPQRARADRIDGPAELRRLDDVPLWERVLLAALFEPEFSQQILEGIEDGMLNGLISEQAFRTVLQIRRSGMEPTLPRLRAEGADEAVLDLVERMAVGQDALPLSKESVQGGVERLRLSSIQRRLAQLKADQGSPGQSYEEQRRRQEEFQSLVLQERAIMSRVRTPAGAGT